MHSFIKYLVLISLLIFLGSPVSAQSPPPATDQPAGLSQGELTQCQFARILVEIIGITGELPPAATDQDYANLLSRYGIEPLKGWDCNAILTRCDLAVILARALKLEEEEDCRGYIMLLTRKGLPLPPEGMAITFAVVSNILNEEIFAELIAIAYRTRTTPI